jgi:hypothetical protein
VGHIRNVHRILVGNLKERDYFGDLGAAEDNIKIDLKEIVCAGLDWFHLAQDKISGWAFVNTVMNSRRL